MKRILHAVLVAVFVSVFIAGVWMFAYAAQNAAVAPGRMTPLDGANNFTLLIFGVACAVGGLVGAFHSIFDLTEKR